MHTDTDLGPESDLNRTIKELEKLIGKNWKRLAREFKFTPTDIAAIEHKDPRDLFEQIHQCFFKWKMQEGNSATVTKLRTALTEAGLQHILKQLDSSLAGIHNGKISIIIYVTYHIHNEAYGIKYSP